MTTIRILTIGRNRENIIGDFKQVYAKGDLS